MFGRLKEFINKHKKYILATIAFAAAGYYFYKEFSQNNIEKISTFLDAIQSKSIKDVQIDSDVIKFTLNNSDWYQTAIGNFPIIRIYQQLMNNGIKFQNTVDIIPRELIFSVAIYFFGKETFKYMISRAHKPPFLSNLEQKPVIYSGITAFDDYYGGEQIKEKFKEIIDFLHNSEKYEQMGARIRRGILFYGPPGTGKTLLARALANEAGCSFIKVVASQFREIFVGVGAKRIRQLFNSARKCSNGCIIFIDQIDALGSRSNHLIVSSETTSTINQFLSEMDGFLPTQKVLIIGATNRINLVDQAILRAGRFDLKIYIPLPDVNQRRGIFEKILNKKTGQFHNISPQFIQDIARRSQKWCGADIQNLINESIYKAIQDNREYVNQNHILSAFAELRNKSQVPCK